MTTRSRILSRVIETVDRYCLLRKGDKVLIALSGGPDSVALLHLMKRLEKKFQIRLGSVYINHMLRPRAAKKELSFCHDFCTALAIPFFSEEVDVPQLAKKTKLGVEETARNNRYRILHQLSEREDFSRIAIGHHRDDRAETILFNLLRGAGRQGMMGMPPQRGKIIRPLYDLSRDEIISYLNENNLRFMTDRSNRSLLYTRNKIRHRVIPVLKKQVIEAAVDNMIRFSEILADEDAFLFRKASQIYAKLHSITPGNKIRLDLSNKLEYDVWLKRRLLVQLLAGAGLFDIEYAEIARLIDLIDGKAGSRLSVREGITAEIAGESLYFYRTRRKIDNYPVTIPGRIKLTYPRYWISLEYVDRKYVKRVSGQSKDVALIDAECLSGELYVSGLKRGARFRPFGRPGSKKVGDFLTDLKYPRPLRDELPVLADGNGIVWLAGVEIDQRMAVTAKTRKMARLEIGKYRYQGSSI